MRCALNHRKPEVVRDMEIFGVVNVSGDSLAGFSVCRSADEAAEYGAKLLEQGADHLDIGAQASHGAASFVSPEEEWALLEGPLLALVNLGVIVSVDRISSNTFRDIPGG